MADLTEVDRVPEDPDDVPVDDMGDGLVAAATAEAVREDVDVKGPLVLAPIRVPVPVAVVVSGAIGVVVADVLAAAITAAPAAAPVAAAAATAHWDTLAAVVEGAAAVVDESSSCVLERDPLAADRPVLFSIKSLALVNTLSF